MSRKKKLRPPIKIHGGKYYLSDFIIEHFPENIGEMTYVEPFCGGASVFLNKVPSQEECISDTDNNLIQIWRALRDEPGEFIKRLKRINYTERVFKRAQNRSEKEFDDYLEHAVNEFIIRRMSRGGLKKNFAWSTRERGGKPGDLNAWETIIEQLPIIAERLENVYVLNKPAIDVIKAFNHPNTFIYVDPPYLPETRVSQNSYDFEMTADEHIALSQVLNTFEGKVALSGYPSVLYKRLYDEWNHVKKDIANHASQQKKKAYKTEYLWMNY